MFKSGCYRAKKRAQAIASLQHILICWNMMCKFTLLPRDWGWSSGWSVSTLLNQKFGD